jgi:dTDP-glucose pyrophosphorylase
LRKDRLVGETGDQVSACGFPPDQLMRNGSTCAVLMAGGRSQRMRASRGPLHKTLVEILGVPLLERNICYLLAAGFRDLVVLVSADEPQVIDFAQSRCAALAGARGARLECVVEDVPRGTIGGLALLPRRTDSFFVMAADNLTSLDPAKLVDHHRTSAAAMTIATHQWSLQVPYGELALARGWIRSYEEKPVHRYQVSSALYVVGPEVAESIDPGSRCDTPDLVARLLEKKWRVAAFPHDSSWVDINDAVSYAEAEELVRRGQTDFEQWRDEPDMTVYCLAAMAAGKCAVQVEGQGADRPGSWSVPTASDPEGLASLHARFPGATEPLTSATFDALDVFSGQVVRYHVYTCKVEGLPRDQLGYDWMPVSSRLLLSQSGVPMKRVLAYLQGVAE